MIDLDAERKAATERIEKRDAEAWLGHRANMLRREGGEISLEAARKMWPTKEDDYLRQVVARAEKDRENGRRSLSNVWKSEDLIARGAELFREHPEATAREVWAMLMDEADGRTPGIAESSWINGYATKARKLMRQSDAAEEAVAPEPREPYRKAAVTTSEGPDLTDAPAELDQGDRILLQLGGQRFEATRQGESWDVEFEGSVGGDAMREMMGRVLEGVR